VKYKNTIKLWLGHHLDNDVITRGEWVYVDVLCTSEKYLNVSGGFDPQDTSTTVIVEDGFAEIDVTFDFYKDSTFQVWG